MSQPHPRRPTRSRRARRTPRPWGAGKIVTIVVLVSLVAPVHAFVLLVAISVVVDPEGTDAQAEPAPEGPESGGSGFGDTTGLRGGDMRELAVSPDGSVIAVAPTDAGNDDDRDSSVRVVGSGDGDLRATLGARTEGVDALAWSPDGITIAASHVPGRAWLMELGEGRSGHTDVPLDADVWDLAFSPDGETLAVSADGGVRLWDTSDEQIVATLLASDEDDALVAVDYSPGGDLLAAVDEHGTVHVWDTSTREPAADLLRHETEVTSMVVVDEQTLVTGDTDGAVHVWDVVSGRRAQSETAHGDQVSALAVSPDGRRVASADVDGEVLLWSSDAWAVLDSHQFTWLLLGQRTWSLSFLPDGDHLAVAGDSGLDLIEVRSPEPPPRR